MGMAIDARADSDSLGHHGQVNGYGSKFTGLVLMPIIAMAGYALIGLTAVLRPEKFQGRR